MMYYFIPFLLTCDKNFIRLWDLLQSCYVNISVTTLGKLSPLWQNLKRFWQFFEGLLGSIWQKLLPNLQILYTVGQFLKAVNGLITKN